jgi:hypothetical protein
MLDLKAGLQYSAEVVKVVGGFASFYAVIKLRQIERRYLFKATVPELIAKVEKALSVLSLSLSTPTPDRTGVAEALNYLIVDAKNIKRKSRGDTLRACNDLLKMIRATRPRRYFWQTEAPMVIGKTILLDIYGKGRGLIRSLENDVQDQGWSSK